MFPKHFTEVFLKQFLDVTNKGLKRGTQVLFEVIILCTEEKPVNYALTMH